LPTHRELARELGVAIGTITRAYDEAERRGLIHGEGRRGTFVGGVPKDLSTLSTYFDSESRIVDLSKNHPTYSEDPSLSLALRSLARRTESQELLQYPEPSGLARHRLGGVKWLAKMGMTVDPDSILITAGAQHALLVVFSAIARRGDVVLVADHTYPGIKAIADLFELELVGLPLDRDGILPDALDAVCKKKKVRILYSVPTIQNPTNAVMPADRRQHIAEIAEKYGLEIVEDEINRRMVPDPPPLISHYAPHRSYLIASVSKVVAAGLRVGYVTAPSRARQNLTDALVASTLAVSPLPAEIITSWIEDGTAEKTIENRRTDSRIRQELASAIFEGYRLGSYPTSYFVWLELPDRWTTMEFTMEARRRGVALTPAEIFAVDRKTARNAVRISISTAIDHSTLQRALQILRDMLDSSPRHDSTAV
jgi:DNA-binding transcriptional MocR family regulator